MSNSALSHQRHGDGSLAVRQLTVRPSVCLSAPVHDCANTEQTFNSQSSSTSCTVISSHTDQLWDDSLTAKLTVPSRLRGSRNLHHLKGSGRERKGKGREKRRGNGEGAKETGNEVEGWIPLPPVTDSLSTLYPKREPRGGLGLGLVG